MLMSATLVQYVYYAAQHVSSQSKCYAYFELQAAACPGGLLTKHLPGLQVVHSAGHAMHAISLLCIG